jgi:hypothetical protein
MIAGIIEYEGALYRTPNVEKFLGKHREMDKSKVSIHAVPDNITNRADIDRTLSEIEAKLKGISIKDKIVKDEQRPYTHTYRVNVNTVLCAYSQEELDRLKQNYIK